MRTLAPKGGGLCDAILAGKGNKACLIRMWKPLPNRCVLKILRGSLKEKAQRRQYLLAVDLGCYMNDVITQCLFVCAADSCL